MSDIAYTGIDAGITIIGFIISYMLIIKQKNLAVQQQKNEWQTEKLAGILESMLELIKDLEYIMAKEKINEKKYYKRKRKINNIIICYGTESSIRIWNYFKYKICTCRDDSLEMENAQIIAPLVLLVMQIKYDTTNIRTSPKIWYTEYTSQMMMETGFYDRSVKEINKIVDLLELPSFLKITKDNIF